MLKYFMAVCLVLCASDAASQESSQYEYLKPSAEADHDDFNQVYYKTEVDGISLIGSMTMEGKWLIFNFVLKNQGGKVFQIRQPDITFFYKDRDLTVYEGAPILDDRGQNLGLGLNPVESECKALPGEFCLGRLYIALPNDFTNGSRLSLRIPIDSQLVETQFIYEQNWMTGDSYREKVDRAKLEGRF